MTEGVTVTYQPAGGRRRRVRFEPLERPAHGGDWYRRVEEEFRDGAWRSVGGEAVQSVQIEVSDGVCVMKVNIGP